MKIAILKMLFSEMSSRLEMREITPGSSTEIIHSTSKSRRTCCYMQISEIRDCQAKVLSVLLLAGGSHSSSRVYLFHMQLEIEKTARFITIIFVPLSGLGQEQVTEINKRSRELGATEDTAIFYDKTKVGDHHLEDILKGKYKWVYI